MMRDDDETVEFEGVRVQHATDKALLCVIDGEAVWIPFSQIADGSELNDSSEVADIGTLVVSEWLATEKGLV